MAKPTLEAFRPVPNMQPENLTGKPAIIAIQGAEMASRMTDSLFNAVEKPANSSIGETSNVTNESDYKPTTTVDSPNPTRKRKSWRTRLATTVLAGSVFSGIGVSTAATAEAAPAPAKAGPAAVAPAFEAQAAAPATVLAGPVKAGATDKRTILQTDIVKKKATLYGRAYEDAETILGKKNKGLNDSTEVLEVLEAQINRGTNPHPDLIITGQKLTEMNDKAKVRAISYVIHRDESNQVTAEVKTAVNQILKNKGLSQEKKLVKNEAAAQTIFNAITTASTASRVDIPTIGKKTKPEFAKESKADDDKDQDKNQLNTAPVLQRTGDLPAAVYVDIDVSEDTIWEFGTNLYMLHTQGDDRVQKLGELNVTRNAEKALIMGYNDKATMPKDKKLKGPSEPVSDLIAELVPYLNKPAEEIPYQYRRLVRDFDHFAYHPKGKNQADPKDGTRKYIDSFIVGFGIHTQVRGFIEKYNATHGTVTPEQFNQQMNLAIEFVDYYFSLDAEAKNKYTALLNNNLLSQAAIDKLLEAAISGSTTDPKLDALNKSITAYAGIDGQKDPQAKTQAAGTVMDKLVIAITP